MRARDEHVYSVGEFEMRVQMLVKQGLLAKTLDERDSVIRLSRAYLEHGTSADFHIEPSKDYRGVVNDVTALNRQLCSLGY